MAHIILLAPQSVDPLLFQDVAQELNADITIVHESDALRRQLPDILFWYSDRFDVAIYSELITLCPQLVWFTSARDVLTQRLGGRRLEPLEPIAAFSDPMEVAVIVRHLFPSHLSLP
jgi:hypothetical protein